VVDESFGFAGGNKPKVADSGVPSCGFQGLGFGQRDLEVPTATKHGVNLISMVVVVSSVLKHLDPWWENRVD
jgi:hypothetical protein